MGYIKCFDSGDDAMRMSELKRREVINVCDCKRLGFVGDLDVDPCTGRILAIIVPGPGCVCGFLGREKEFVIPFGDICQIGDDIILVRVEEKKEKPPKPPKPCPPPPARAGPAGTAGRGPWGIWARRQSRRFVPARLHVSREEDVTVRRRVIWIVAALRLVTRKKAVI